MTTALAFLGSLMLLACGFAVHVYRAEQQRRKLLSRADTRIAAVPISVVLSAEPNDGFWARFGEWLRRHTPASWSQGKGISDQLVRAGYVSAVAPVVYVTARLALMVGLPLLAAASATQRGLSMAALYAAGALGLAIVAPPVLVGRKVRLRQERIRRSLPDSLDLLVVCVEAGISLDAAILRVAREMEIMHPELSGELLVVNRKVNAGITREVALHGLWNRTGVEELRALSSSMIQSERWGTSISTVLRVNAETMRRKRRQAAEKRAAETAIKLIFPLTMLIFPALFIVILGPAAINLSAIFRSIGP